jgi:hypothetical protein
MRDFDGDDASLKQVPCKTKEELKDMSQWAKRHDNFLYIACPHQHKIALCEWYADDVHVRCRYHGASEHDYFISYRVDNNEGSAVKKGNGLAHNLFDLLNSKDTPCYLDGECLQNGENWKPGFLHGVSHSKLLVLLISRGSMAILKKNTEEKRVDNVFEVLMRAVYYKLSGKARIMPINVQVDENDDFLYFKDCGGEYFVNEPYVVGSQHMHLSELEGETFKIKTVRDVVRALFALNAGTIVANNKESIRAAVEEIQLVLKGSKQVQFENI